MPTKHYIYKTCAFEGTAGTDPHGFALSINKATTDGWRLHSFESYPSSKNAGDGYDGAPVRVETRVFICVFERQVIAGD